jgi:amino-acid N-acetyltransferase
MYIVGISYRQSAQVGCFTYKPMCLPAQCQLRSAQSADLRTIKRLVLRAFLDPTQLKWQQFWVVTYREKVIACGQLRRYGRAQELGSLVVHPRWRSQGIGRALAGHLITQAQGPLYLECLGQGRKAFFAQLGFRVANWQTMPPEMAAKFRWTRRLANLMPVPLYVMEYCPPEGKP